MIKVILIHLDERPETIMPLIYKTHPEIIRLLSLVSEPKFVRFYKKLNILKNGLHVYQEYPPEPN